MNNHSLNVNPWAAQESAAALQVALVWGGGGLVLLALAPLFARLLCRALGLVKPNFKGNLVPAAVGLTFLLVGAVAYAALALSRAAIGERAPVFLLVTLGFGLLGLLDDRFGARADAGGFRGHARALFAGRPTTGGLKLLGGGLIALAASWLLHTAGPGGRASGGAFFALVSLDALVIALAANALNLLDVRPGRALFGFVLLALPTVIVVARTQSLQGGALLGVLVLAACVEAWPDARGRAMMGDTGSNLLGACAGLAAVIELPLWGRMVLFAVLAGLNLAAERVSLSAVIERSPLLRALDRRLGVRS